MAANQLSPDSPSRALFSSPCHRTPLCPHAPALYAPCVVCREAPERHKKALRKPIFHTPLEHLRVPEKLEFARIHATRYFFMEPGAAALPTQAISPPPPSARTANSSPAGHPRRCKAPQLWTITCACGLSQARSPLSLRPNVPTPFSHCQPPQPIVSSANIGITEIRVHDIEGGRNT